eukprot:350297-Chlamydomonas_euryale.AAC.1
MSGVDRGCGQGVWTGSVDRECGQGGADRAGRREAFHQSLAVNESIIDGWGKFGLMDACMHACMDGSMDQWMDGWSGGRYVDVWMG